jgi:catalase-peroxidase
MTIPSKCPFSNNSQILGTNVLSGSSQTAHWWPNQLNLKVLHNHSSLSDPMPKDFCYTEEFKTLDLHAVVDDLHLLMRDSQDWWPADFGHYGPFFLRMAWHSAGTYRISDGRGGAGSGAQRFAPLNSWPDNGNLDKARRLLWPVKQKYGKKLSWADLMILAGNVALESMGLKTLGFAGGREDIWEPEEEINWGSERKWLGNERYSKEGELQNPLAAVQMGLIYVNPEGPNGIPDPLASANDIRQTFARMAMNDEETVALIAGGHTFGKCHGAASPSQYVGPEPEGANLEDQGFGWKNTLDSGNGKHTITSGIEGAWTTNPIKWDNNYFENLFAYDWVLSKSPAGAHQWIPKNPNTQSLVPDAHDPSLRHTPIMTTADLALKMDPSYQQISKRFLDSPQEFADAFAKAWFKLTHRDMGPVSRYLGPLVPKVTFIWQDPIPKVNHLLIDENDVIHLKTKITSLGFSLSDFVSLAWGAASTFRCTDKRGGANGARIRLHPQKNWEVNRPSKLAEMINSLEGLQSEFNRSHTSGKHISLSDLIVLAGCVAVELAAENAGDPVKVPFIPGRMDASQSETDSDSFDALEPMADAFRNYVAKEWKHLETELFIEKASLLGLTAPEAVVLLGGMRVLNTNFDQSKHGVFTLIPERLTNDFFLNLLDMSTHWQKSPTIEGIYEGIDRKTRSVKWTATAVDLVIGSHSQLRAIAEVYACADSKRHFAETFVKVWSKIMNLDRFEIKNL